MKNKICALMLALLLVLAGCGGKEVPGFSEADLVLTVSGAEYRCRDNIQTVIAKLGEDYRYVEGMSCNYDGLDKTYIFPAATFKGIKTGAKKADVTAIFLTVEPVWEIASPSPLPFRGPR